MQKRWVSGLKRRDSEEVNVRFVRLVEDMVVERSKSEDSLWEKFATITTVTSVEIYPSSEVIYATNVRVHVYLATDFYNQIVIYFTTTALSRISHGAAG